MSGYIKLHRALLDWEWYSAPNMAHLFTHLLLKANYKRSEWRGVVLESGQFISGRKQLAQETGLSEQAIRTCLNRLKSTNEVTIKTTSKFSVFTINSWEKYQSSEDANQQDNQQCNQQVTSNQPATNHIQEVKEEKEKKKKERKASSNSLHSFEDSPYFDLEEFKLVALDRFAWLPDIASRQHEKAIAYSNSSPKRYKDWMLATYNWWRKDEYTTEYQREVLREYVAKRATFKTWMRAVELYSEQYRSPDKAKALVWLMQATMTEHGWKLNDRLDKDPDATGWREWGEYAKDNFPKYYDMAIRALEKTKNV